MFVCVPSVDTGYATHSLVAGHFECSADGYRRDKRGKDDQAKIAKIDDYVKKK